MIKVRRAVAGAVETNIYIAVNEENHCVILDPADHAEMLIQMIEEKLSLVPEAILLTHGHFDHILAAEAIAEHFGIRIYAAEAEAELLRDPAKNLSVNMSGRSVSIRDFVPLHDGDKLSFLGTEWQVLETPGHTEGSVCYFLPEAKELQGEAPMLFSGDTLFLESYGRTDFPGGSEVELFRSIQEKILPLPEHTRVYPGHGEDTEIGYERKHNPLALGWRSR